MRVVRDEDPDVDVGYLQERGFEDRLAEYKRGGLRFTEMWIEANVGFEDDVQALVTSPGLSGIESDTTEEELDALIAEEWRALRAALKTVGVPTEQLPLDAQREWIEWRTT